ARLRAADELGCRARRGAGEAGHAGALPMKARSGPSSPRVAALVGCFLAGVLVDAWLRVHGPPLPVTTTAEERQPSAAALPTSSAQEPREPHMSAAPAPKLRMPLDGVDVERMKGSFSEVHSGHPHEAVDLLAPRNAPVHAVEDGRIAR